MEYLLANQFLRMSDAVHSLQDLNKFNICNNHMQSAGQILKPIGAKTGVSDI